MNLLNKLIIAAILALVIVGGYFSSTRIFQDFKVSDLENKIIREANSNNRSPIPVSFGEHLFYIDLAITQYEKERGLGGSDFLDDDEGMLFIYEEPTYPAIWMKNMAFPIDIVWLNESFVIVDKAEGVSPSTYPASFSPNIPAKYVLEVNSGFLAKNGITFGDVLRLADDTQ